MDRIQLVQSVLDGRRPDRPPLSFWCHFSADQVWGRPAVDAHVAHLEAWDLDFLKVMNDNRYPHDGRIRDVADLASLAVLGGDEAGFARQLDLLADLKRELAGRVLMTTTVFNAWATLRRLVGPPKIKHGPPDLVSVDDQPSSTIKRFLADDAAAVATALRTIGASLANFARRCIEAGADGVFLSVRDDWVDSPGVGQSLYRRLVRPTDLDILAGAAGGRLNIVHVCGKGVDFRAFAEYPAHVINWADRAAGPAIRDVCGWVRPALSGGVDNLSTLPDGTPDDVCREVVDALAQAGDRPLIITPGCTYDPQVVPRANLEALCHAVRTETRSD